MNKVKVEEDGAIVPIFAKYEAFGENPEEYTPERRLIAAILIRAIQDATNDTAEKIRNKADKSCKIHERKTALAFLSASFKEPYPDYSCLWCLSFFHDSPERAQKLILEIIKNAQKSSRPSVYLGVELAIDLAVLVRSKKNKKLIA
jgi:hypothetical protein